MKSDRLTAADGTRSSRRALYYYLEHLPPEERRRRRGSGSRDQGGYTHMLIEDVSNGIMPFDVERAGCSIRLSVQDRQVENLVTKALARTQYERSLARAACEFVRECTQAILSMGEAAYEVEYFHKGQEDAPIGFGIGRIDPRTIYHRRGKIYQHVPASIKRGHDLPDRIELNNGCVFAFTPPKTIRTGLEMAFDGLSSVKLGLPDFAIAAMTAPNMSAQFEWRVHFSTQHIALAEATRFIGWNARNIFREDMLEYYWVHRELLFEKFKAQMREFIIRETNKIINSAGQRLQFDAQLLIDGLPTEETVSSAMEQLKSGDADFYDILKPFRLA